MILVIAIIILTIYLTAGAALPAWVAAFGFTAGQLILMGLAGLAIAFIVSPEGAKEGLNRAIGGISDAISGIASGVGSIIKNGTSSLISASGIGTLLLFGGAAFVGYKLLSSDNTPQKVNLEIAKGKDNGN